MAHSISIALIDQTAELHHFKQAVELTDVGATRPKPCSGARKLVSITTHERDRQTTLVSPHADRSKLGLWHLILTHVRVRTVWTVDIPLTKRNAVAEEQ